MTVWPKDQETSPQSQNNFSSAVYQFIRCYENPEGNGNLNGSGYHNLESIKFLLKYLQMCWDAIQRSLQSIEENDPKNAFQKIAREHTTESSAFDGVIQKYREALIKNGSTSEKAQ